MSRNTVRIALIVLVGLALIAVAIVLSKSRKPRKVTGPGAAAVLAADAGGAVTQTDERTLRGYDRSGKLVWKQAPQYIKDAQGTPRYVLSNAFCAGACPAAYTNNVAANRNHVIAYDINGSGGAQTLGEPFNDPGVSIRGVVNGDNLVIGQPAGSGYEYLFAKATAKGSPAQRLSPAVPVSAKTGLVVLPDDAGTRVQVMESGAGRKNPRTTLRWFEWVGGRWRQAGKPVSLPRAEACFSGDGRRAALVAKRVTLMDFGGSHRHTLKTGPGPGNCMFSSNGITVTTPAVSNKLALTFTNYTDAGDSVWQRTFTRAASFNARGGNDDLIQVVTNLGMQLISAADGKTMHSYKNQYAAYPTGKNQFVVADTVGVPRWLP